MESLKSKKFKNFEEKELNELIQKNTMAGANTNTSGPTMDGYDAHGGISYTMDTYSDLGGLGEKTKGHR